MCPLSQQQQQQQPRVKNGGAVEQVLPVQPLEEAPAHQRLPRHPDATLPGHRPRHPRHGLPSILRGMAVRRAVRDGRGAPFSSHPLVKAPFDLCVLVEIYFPLMFYYR